MENSLYLEWKSVVCEPRFRNFECLASWPFYNIHPWQRKQAFCRQNHLGVKCIWTIPGIWIKPIFLGGVIIWFLGIFLRHWVYKSVEIENEVLLWLCCLSDLCDSSINIHGSHYESFEMHNLEWTVRGSDLRFCVSDRNKVMLRLLFMVCAPCSNGDFQFQ